MNLHRCYICKKRKGKLDKIYMSFDKYEYFHEQCIRNVLSNPKDFSYEMVDRVLYTDGRLKVEINRRMDDNAIRETRIENSLIRRVMMYEKFLDRLGIDIDEEIKRMS